MSVHYTLIHFMYVYALNGSVRNVVGRGFIGLERNGLHGSIAQLRFLACQLLLLQPLVSTLGEQIEKMTDIAN